MASDSPVGLVYKGKGTGAAPEIQIGELVFGVLARRFVLLEVTEIRVQLSATGPGRALAFSVGTSLWLMPLFPGTAQCPCSLGSVGWGQVRVQYR